MRNSALTLHFTLLTYLLAAQDGAGKEEIKIKLSGPLKKQLIVDWENVTRNTQVRRTASTHAHSLFQP